MIHFHEKVASQDVIGDHWPRKPQRERQIRSVWERNDKKIHALSRKKEFSQQDQDMNIFILHVVQMMSELFNTNQLSL